MGAARDLWLCKTEAPVVVVPALHQPPFHGNKISRRRTENRRTPLRRTMNLCLSAPLNPTEPLPLRSISIQHTLSAHHI